MTCTIDGVAKGLLCQILFLFRHVLISKFKFPKILHFDRRDFTTDFASLQLVSQCMTLKFSSSLMIPTLAFYWCLHHKQLLYGSIPVLSPQRILSAQVHFSVTYIKTLLLIKCALTYVM